MVGYILKRIIGLFFTMLGAVSLIFFIMRAIPGNPAALLAGPDASPEVVIMLTEKWHLDQPLYNQFIRYLHNLVRFDLGRSFVTNRPVIFEILTRSIKTIELALYAFVLGAGIGLPLGVIAGVKKNTYIDDFVTTISVIGISIPRFWLGMMLVWLFGVHLKWLPAIGSADIRHAILPAITLSVAPLAIIARQCRSGIIDVLNEDYIRTARSKGLAESIVIYRHALKNTMISVLTIMGVTFGYLLGGSVVVETVFSYFGIGKLAIDSILARDYAVIEGVVLFMALMFGLMNLIVDLGYALLDPRIKYN